MTNKGKDFIKTNLYIDKFTCGTNAIRHNAVVAEQYSAAVKRDDVKEILTEHQVRCYVKDKIEELKNDRARRQEYWEWKG